jgi:hypothetical protein
MDLNLQEEHTLIVPAKANWTHKSTKAKRLKEEYIVGDKKKKKKKKIEE